MKSANKHLYLHLFSIEISFFCPPNQVFTIKCINVSPIVLDGFFKLDSSQGIYFLGEERASWCLRAPMFLWGRIIYLEPILRSSVISSASHLRFAVKWVHTYFKVLACNIPLQSLNKRFRPVFVFLLENHPLNACVLWRLFADWKYPIFNGSEFECFLSPNYWKFAVECDWNRKISQIRT